MKRIILRSLSVVAVSAGIGAWTTAHADNPTFTKDVAPILQKHCQECHRPGEAVPMTLMSYEEVRPWVKSIRKNVSERLMPPWHADPSIQHFKNDRRMTEEEVSKIVAWADTGAVMGDPKDLPAPRQFSSGWKIGTPDAIFTFDHDQVLSPELNDEYRYVVMHTNFKEDHWLKATECRAGNVNVVHHIIAFGKPPGMSFAEGRRRSGAQGEGFAKPQAEAGEQGDQKGRGQHRGRPGFGDVTLLGGMAPGTDPHVMPVGEGMFLPAGSDIVFQMHYHKEPGKEEHDSSMIGLKFADYTVTKQRHADAVANPMFSIPPNAENHEVKAILTLDEDIELKTVMPHMHLRGKDMKVWAVYPDGHQEDLIWVPKYDFNWQTIYEFTEPVKLPKGAKLFAVAHYNNSKSNPFNPDPNVTVHFGEPTTAEMMFAFLSYTSPAEKLDGKEPAVVAGGGAQ